MKVLGKDKIVETYRFPFSEALSFSILIWTIWGLVESFFWQRAWPFFDANAIRVHHFIYLSAFFIYVGVASVVAAMMYSGTKWILFTLNQDGNIRFRGITYSLILGTFFLTAIPFVYNEHLSRSTL